ncbi:MULTISPECIES: hypothetical protein [unclassified Bradyrhizobium]|uniref:hypothetical protein n=1 Tax=unclassified Bradyrhizobium TaxID=2631580 RepID=UPI002916016D|nr:MULTISPECIES: hypothetical protein [unclassified Bradyrhizobium]
MTESAHENVNLPPPGTLAGNLGEPIRLTGIQLDGISGEAAREAETFKVYTRLCLTSDDKFFHRIAASIRGHIELVAGLCGQPVDLTRADMVLLVSRADGTGELWLDTAAVSMKILTKRTIAAGTAVFESDIADVTAMSFPAVRIGKEDRVVCLFREGWRFGLFFDFNPKGEFSLSAMQTDLGTLHRRMRYRDLYDAIADPAVYSKLTAAGWFPFAEILGPEFQSLVNASEAGFDLGEEERRIVSAFDAARVERMFARWMQRPHFAGKEPVLRAAQRAFAADDAVSVLKIALTEIEGILGEAHRKVHGQGAKIKTLVEFAVASAEKKAGRPDTLLLASAFADYLKTQTFATFDPVANTGHAGSRHAVGHGAASPESYTMVRALQALLTLDQLAFYT